MQDKTMNKAGCIRQNKRNTLAVQTEEDKDFIHIREGSTGGNNQGLGMTSDQ